MIIYELRNLHFVPPNILPKITNSADVPQLPIQPITPNQNPTLVIKSNKIKFNINNKNLRLITSLYTTSLIYNNEI